MDIDQRSRATDAGQYLYTTLIQIQPRFEDRVVPFRATFFRSSLATRVLFDCPLFDIEGVGMYTLAIDLLHSWQLGPLQRFIAFCLMFMLKAKVWGKEVPGLTAEESRQIGILRLRAELWIYYRQEKKRDPTWSDRYSEVTIYIYIYICIYKYI